jgi:hypothetical protein
MDPRFRGFVLSGTEKFSAVTMSRCRLPTELMSPLGAAGLGRGTTAIRNDMAMRQQPQASTQSGETLHSALDCRPSTRPSRQESVDRPT